MRLLSLAIALAFAAPAQASTLAPIGSPAQLGRVVQVTTAGDTLAIGAVQHYRLGVWLAAPDGSGLHRVAEADARYFDLTPDGRYLLLGDRRFDLQSGAPSVIPQAAFERILSPDGSVFFATATHLRRLAPDGGLTDVSPRRLDGTAWAAAGHGEPGARGLGWCGFIDHRAALGLFDPLTGRLSLKSSGVRGHRRTECVTSRDGGTTGTIVLTGHHAELVLRSARGGIHRARVVSDAPLFLSPGGRYALAGDVLVDTVTGHTRQVPSGGVPVWSADEHVAREVPGRRLLVLDARTGHARRIGALDPHAPAPVAFAPGNRNVFGAHAWYSATPTSQPAALSGSLFTRLWFGACRQGIPARGRGCRAYVTDPAGALLTTPAAGFGETALVR
jgi:hypothetical protein